ncbi:hypothetical protein KY334_01060 [Candidatus Woesearchaeota archaeon]|nr:hypothetical protein [Candidatus Woesearchaeota archaeon]
MKLLDVDIVKTPLCRYLVLDHVYDDISKIDDWALRFYPGGKMAFNLDPIFQHNNDYAYLRVLPELLEKHSNTHFEDLRGNSLDGTIPEGNLEYLVSDDMINIFIKRREEKIKNAPSNVKYSEMSDEELFKGIRSSITASVIEELVFRSSQNSLIYKSDVGPVGIDISEEHNLLVIRDINTFTYHGTATGNIHIHKFFYSEHVKNINEVPFETETYQISEPFKTEITTINSGLARAMAEEKNIPVFNLNGREIMLSNELENKIPNFLKKLLK